MKIIVDADGCPKPVLRISMKVGRRYGIQVWTVASFNHNIDSDHHVVVGNDPQEADIKIINLTEEGDIIVSQDWGYLLDPFFFFLSSWNPGNSLTNQSIII